LLKREKREKLESWLPMIILLSGMVIRLQEENDLEKSNSGDGRSGGINLN
jgi:hypothetical protein